MFNRPTIKWRHETRFWIAVVILAAIILLLFMQSAVGIPLPWLLSLFASG